MANLLREIRHLPSREDIWIILGFNALCITLFIMSFPRTLALWTLGAFLFFGLICWIKDFPRIITALKHNKIVILAPVIYFILYLIYFIFGDHLWGYVEDKLMFLLVPLLGLPLFISDYLRRNLRILLLSFLSGLLIICLYQITRAAFESLSLIDNKLIFQPFIKPGVSRFVWDQLSNLEHPSYLAIKIIWAIVLLFFARDTLKIKLWLTYILIALFSIFVYFLAAKAQLLIFIILLIYTLFFRFKTSRSRIILIVLIPLSIFAVFRMVSQNVRVEQKLNQIEEQKAKGTIDWKDFDHRTRSWFSSLALIEENPILGVGLNARNILSEKYRDKGYNIEADFRLNSHNQYLETQLTLGIAGSIVLLWMLIVPLFKRKHTWNPDLIVLFLIIITVSMIFESILVRQWGIMFFVLFYCLILLPGMARQEQSKSEI